MGKYEVDFYKNARGQSPTLELLKEFLKNNDKKRARNLLNSFYHRLDRIRVNGTLDGMPDFEKIDGTRYPLWQIRIKHSIGYFRIFVCWSGQKYVVLNTFQKKQGKTPQREIKLAERLMEDYLLQQTAKEE